MIKKFILLTLLCAIAPLHAMEEVLTKEATQTHELYLKMKELSASECAQLLNTRSYCPSEYYFAYIEACNKRDQETYFKFMDCLGADFIFRNSVVHGDSINCKGLIQTYAIDVNKQTPSGYTALHFAVEKNYKEIVLLLLKNGADTTITAGPQKETPLDRARATNNTEICKILLKSYTDQETPLEETDLPYKSEVHTFLLNNGASINRLLDTIDEQLKNPHPIIEEYDFPKKSATTYNKQYLAALVCIAIALYTAKKALIDAQESYESTPSEHNRPTIIETLAAQPIPTIHVNRQL